MMLWIIPLRANERESWGREVERGGIGRQKRGEEVKEKFLLTVVVAGKPKYICGKEMIEWLNSNISMC